MIFSQSPDQAVPSRRRVPTSIDGFTLVEMLVAMAVTLIMMAALARAFGFVGRQVQNSRADTQLATNLRDITTRLSDDLAQCTVELKPNAGEEDQNGYFLYYEGPVTDATSSLFRADDSSGKLELSDARYGDFDDYIAFTAVAKGNQWFKGKVPRYILNQKSAEIAGVNYDPANFNGNPFDPVVITSKYAEIIYFASPEYTTSTLPQSPAYTDVDGDTDLGSGSASENGLPDRLKIHRRVLLIRPDLNLNNGILPQRSKPGDSDGDGTNDCTVLFMQADTWPTANGNTITPNADNNLGWLYGMAGVHQQCDLSIRRVLGDNGLPTTSVAANSLAELSQPHNRFAHVRVPDNGQFGTGNANITSMPVLALGRPATVLSTQTSRNPARIAPPETPNAGPVVTPTALSGFLRPEFVLGNNLTHLNDVNDRWGLQRIGEDLVTNNALGFDVQIFDPGASLYSDNPLNSATAEINETVGPGDADFRSAMTAYVGNDAINKREKGCFVDLAYPVLAGGSLRGWQPRRLDRRQGANHVLPSGSGGQLISSFSGIRSASNNSTTAYQDALYRSGRLVTSGNSIRLFQPAFDTYTSAYERDGFFQGENSGSRGSLWTPFTIATNPSGVYQPDQGANGLDDDGTFGVDDLGERETLAPFRNQAQAIRVSIRMENPAMRLIRQSSVEYRGR